MKTKRLLAGLLTLVMLVGLLPTAALAAKRDDDAVPMEAPAAGSPAAPAAPAWEDAPATLAAGVDLSDPKWGNLALDMIKNEGNTAVTFNPAGSGNWGSQLSYMTDGKYDTANAYTQSQIPTSFNSTSFDENFYVQFDLGENRTVGGFEFSVVGDGETHGFKYTIYGKAAGDTSWTPLTEDVSISHAAGENIKQHPLSAETSLRYVRVVLHSGHGGAVGAFSEFKIFGLKPLDLSTLTNIAKGMSPTLPNNDRTTDGSNNPKSNLTDDNNGTEFEMYGKALPTEASTGPEGNPCFLDFDFDENRSIGGFEFVVSTALATSYTYKYDIYGKADGGSSWTKFVDSASVSHASGANVNTHPLTALTDLRYVRFVIHSGNQWGAISEIRIFAEAPDPYEGLVNVAPLSSISVPSNEDQIGKIIDGNVGTWWAAGTGDWPANIDFALPGNLAVKRVELDFERFNGRTFDLSVSRAVNNVTSDYEQLTTKNGHSANETFVYDMAEPQRMTHVRVSLLATNGQAWPGIAEVRIYAVDETIDLNNYTNITQYAGEPKTGDGYKEWDFHGNQQIAGFRVSLPEGVTAVLKGKMKRGSSWTTYFTELQNGDNVFDFLKGMSTVRLELSDISQLTDLQIFGTYTAPIIDSGSIAFDIVPHTNYGSATAYLLTDGNTEQPWTAEMYPVYIDIDLEQNYNLSQIEIYAPENGQTEYTLYTSMDGRDFTIVDEAHTTGPKAGPSAHTLSNVEARIVRVYVEYYSLSAQPSLNEIRVMGTPSGTAVRPTPEVTVEAFEDTAYAAPITNQDVYDEVYGIIRRQINEKNPNDVDYTQWFTLDIQPTAANGYDYFTLTDEGGKIKVTGNNGVSLATGINHYLKYFCNVHISQVGNQVNMPAAIVPINGTVHKETKFPVRYAYNYCTHSYTMSFWNEPEWRNELDWQALNGVNVVLDITGQEEVWREFLMSVGYTHQEAKDFLAGPGYYAWAYMANLTGFGGPVHDSFLTQRVELGRKNQRIMRTLGMYPVLQAFSGMVPVDITDHDPNAQVIPQGGWCGFQRPTMLKTDTTTYDEYAAKFYAAQKRVFGDAKYYATDPFHEGGNTGGMSGATVASALLDSLLDFDSDAVWIIQCWQENPSNALLAGLGNRRTDHALVLDLYAEKTEYWKGHHGKNESPDVVEFSDTPWVWCMLNNFGGRMGLHGHLDALQKNIPAAANSANHMAGVGMSPEGAQENPVLYDFLFETIWTDNASQALPTIDLDQWLKDYVRRRYGAQSDNAEAAMEILAQTVYKSSLNMTGQGSPESVVNARPALSIQAASTWGNSSINYSKAKLEKAAALLLEDYDTLSASDAYLYDVADVLKQILSNTAQKVHSDMAAAYNSGNAAEFETQSDRFLALIDKLEEVLGTRSEFTFGKWTEGAELMAENTDDFTERLYLRNAKALVTTWGSKEQNGGLKDYSNRQWAGLTNDYYKARWIIWIGQAKQNLANNIHSSFDNTFDWFAFEWAYARNHQVTYSSTPNGKDLKELGEQVLTDYSVRDPLGENDIDPATMTVKCGTEHYAADGEDDRAINVLDRDTGTIWHTEWTPSTAPKSDWWIAFDLGKATAVDGLRYLPRQGSNTTGRITGYKVYVSSSDTDWAGTTDNWEPVVENGTWANNGNWKTASFDWKLARYVKLVATSSTHAYVSASEIRITFPSTIPVETITLDQTSLTLYVNGDHDHTATLTATVSPELATDKAVTWSTGDVEVAAVNSTTGAVTAMGIGTTTITATAHDGSGVTAVCAVTVKKVVEGELSLSGALKFGSTLTANGAFDSDVLNNLTYTWYRGESASGTPLATGKTYTPVEGDIGSKLTVKASAKEGTLYDGAVTFTTATTVTKADGHKMLDADPAYENCSAQGVNDGKITGLRADHVYQYQKQVDGDWPTDEASWITAPANSTEITGLAPGDYRVRHVGDATRFPGEPSNTVTIVVEGGSEKKLTIPPRFEGGTVRANRAQIPAEDTVTLTVTPDTGYELSTLVATYTDGDGVKQTLTPTLQSNGKYTFTMPAFPVTIAAAFTKITYTIGHGLDHITCNEAEHQHTATYEVPFSIILTPDEGYNMPNTLTVTETGTTTKFTDFTYEVHETDPTKRVLTFPNGVTCHITISGAGVLKTYTIDHRLTDIACDMEGEEQHRVTHGAALSIHLTAAQGYYLPEQVTVTMSGQAFGDFTYTRTSDTEGQLTIAAGKITGPLVISAAGAIPLTSVTVQGTAQVGQTLTAQVRPTAAKVSYQWYRGETAIENATGKTYTLTEADLDAAIKVEVTGVEGYTGTKTSGAVIVEPVPVEKTALQTAYNAAKDVEQGNYTDASWAAFEAAREQALAVLENADATQAEVDAAAKALTNAQKALKKPSTTRPSTTTTPTTETKEDGTKVTTETKPDGTKVETVEEPDGTKAVTETKKDGTVTETVEEPDGTKAVTETKPDGSKTATVEQADGTKSETVVTADGDATITVTDPEGEEIAKVEIPATIPEPEDKFVDIDQTPWAEEAINKVAGLELVKGIGGNKYDPVTPMTRGALATVLHRLSNGKTDYAVVFKDVQENRYYTEGVAWAAKANVVKGISEDIFAPDQIITREQLAVMLARYAKLIGMSTKADTKSLEQFTDGDTTGSWAVDGMAWCVEKGILKGKGLNNLDPTADVSRAEVAVMLDRFIALIK